jgi:hypothetical protein
MGFCVAGGPFLYSKTLHLKLNLCNLLPVNILEHIIIEFSFVRRSILSAIICHNDCQEPFLE